jgi:hypothetical protein
MTGTDRGWFATHRRPLTLLSFAVVLGSACQLDSPTGMSRVGDVGLAKGGPGGGGGGGGDVAPTVTATDPTFAVRDTTVDVTIIGSGFTTGAKATWSLAGDTSLVHVKSTKVIAPDRLIARIEVPLAAPVATYDVEVTLSNGKKGVGAEMFDVLLEDPTATFSFPTADAALDVKSDQQFVSGASSVYANGVCGVNSKLFGTSQLSGSGDATLHTNSPSSKDRRCVAYPRTLTVVFAPGDQETRPLFMNLREIHNGTIQIPIGASALKRLTLNNGGRCVSLHWNEQLADGTNTNGGDRVRVTRLDASTWQVESQPFPDNQAYCRETGQLFHLNVKFTVITSRPMP